jgi:hypothetical protein
MLRRNNAALELDRLQRMTTRIAITASAYAAIRESLPTVGSRPPQKEGDLYLVSVPNDTMDKLMAQRGPGESYCDVIIRLAAAEHD